MLMSEKNVRLVVPHVSAEESTDASGSDEQETCSKSRQVPLANSPFVPLPAQSRQKVSVKNTFVHISEGASTLVPERQSRSSTGPAILSSQVADLSDSEDEDDGANGDDEYVDAAKDFIDEDDSDGDMLAMCKIRTGNTPDHDFHADLPNLAAMQRQMQQQMMSMMMAGQLPQPHLVPMWSSMAGMLPVQGMPLNPASFTALTPSMPDQVAATPTRMPCVSHVTTSITASSPSPLTSSETKHLRNTSAQSTVRKTEVPAPEHAGATTVVLRNLPLNYKRSMLLKMLDHEGFAGEYNFIYLPIDFDTAAGLGYAFVNLTNEESVDRFWKVFDGYNRWMFRSAKVCSVSWSNPHQGLPVHIKRFRNSPLMHPSVPDEYRPILLDKGVRVPFPPPTRELWAPTSSGGPKPSKGSRR